MAQLFELFATLGMDTAAFDSAAAKADADGRSLSLSLTVSMQRAAASLSGLAASSASSFSALSRAGSSCAQSLSGSLTGAWNAIGASVQQALEKARAFLSLKGSASGVTSGASPGFATGLDYVPYDRFSAQLHQGEAVLTRLEADAWRSGVKTQTDAPPDLSALADALAGALANVTVALDGEKVGELVTPTVSARLGSAARARRYTG